MTDHELSERIVYQAQRHGVNPNEYARQARETGQLGTIYADVRRLKALATAVRQAAVTDATGNPVDVDALIDSTP